MSMEFNVKKVFVICKSATNDNGNCWIEVKEVVNLEELAEYEWFTNESYEIINTTREISLAFMEVGDIIVSPTEGRKYTLSRIG